MADHKSADVKTHTVTLNCGTKVRVTQKEANRIANAIVKVDGTGYYYLEQVNESVIAFFHSSAVVSVIKNIHGYDNP